jgi:peptide/nickel transport system permease protein
MNALAPLAATQRRARVRVPMLRPDPLLITALAAFFGLLFIAFFGERIAPNEQIYFVIEHGKDPRPYDPGLVFPLGSDVLGRDLFSVVLAGARATLSIVLLAGLARVGAGVLVAALGTWLRPARVLTETIADFVAAVPATLVAVILIKAFVTTDTSVPIMIGTLLLVGWAGPYRVIRAEVDRLAHAQFTEGARVIGVSGARIFWRHHLPHLAPIMAINLSQQIVASLVLLAELGVLGVIVSTVRTINVEASLSVIRTGPQNSAFIPDVPEWGAMLSSARTVEILWLTRWVIFIPGAAFALTAMAVALIGFALARRYARRDFFKDVRGAGVVGVAALILFVASGLVPERYAEAREWAASARAAVQPASDTAAAFKDIGLRTTAVTRNKNTVVRTGLAKVTIGSFSVDEGYALPTDPPNTVHVRSVVSDGVGGGTSVDAPLVFAGRGITHPDEKAPAVTYRQGPPAARLAPLIEQYPNDYAGIDVHGKVVLLARFLGIDAGVRGFVEGTPVGISIADAFGRGAVGVILVDPSVGDPARSNIYPTLPRIGPNTYTHMEIEFPAISTTGAPVIVLDRAAALSLVRPLGVDLDPLLGYDTVEAPPQRSLSRDLGVTARITVPLRVDTSSATSLIGEVPDVPDDTGRVVVWATRDLGGTPPEAAKRDLLVSLARFAAARHAPFTFVEYDPRLDAQSIREFLINRKVLVVLVLDDVHRGVLRFTTANGDLIPAIDLYAEKAGAQHEITRHTMLVEQVGAPLPELRTIVITSIGEPANAREDIAAVVGYMAGRLALGAPELQR